MSRALRDPPPATAPGLLEVAVERRPGEVEAEWVAVEEPLEIRVDGEPLAVTLRTPGHDRELAAGFLFTEGVIDGPEDLVALDGCDNPANPASANVVLARLGERARADRRRIERARREVRAVAGCGLCGKTRLDDVYQRLPEIEPLDVPLELLRELPGRMRPHQEVFALTGGLHAAALFDPEGTLLTLYEDIGRHNAVDKVIGHHLLQDRLPLAGKVLVVSGRAGFEIVQKALVAAVPVVVSVGAASSLAVRLAKDGGQRLYAFASRGRGHLHV